MPFAHIDQKTSRDIISKLRKVAEVNGFEFTHERTRKSKTRDENNVYILAVPETDGVYVESNIGTVTWDAEVIAKLPR